MRETMHCFNAQQPCKLQGHLMRRCMPQKLRSAGSIRGCNNATSIAPPTRECEVVRDKGDGPALDERKGGHHKLGHRQQEAAGNREGAQVAGKTCEGPA